MIDGCGLDRIATVALMRHGGSHLIRPIVAGLGFEIVEPGNFGTPLDEAVGPIIVFLRDPRNRMVATLRWWRSKPRKAALFETGDVSDDAQIRYLLDNQGFLEEMLQWARVWCKWTERNPLHVYFESFDYKSIKAIADHLNLLRDDERDQRLFNTIYKHGRTYTGSHSNWTDSFGPLSIDFWNQNGGGELLQLMGYT
jgi:hypothetical protein